MGTGGADLVEIERNALSGEVLQKMKNVELYGRVGPSLGFKTSFHGAHPGWLLIFHRKSNENQSAGSIIGKFEEYDYDMDGSRSFTGNASRGWKQLSICLGK